MPSDIPQLQDLLNACEYLLRTTAGITLEEFLDDDDKLFGVQHQMMIAGEAVKRLSPEFRAAHPSIEWTKLAGMRDVLIHRYDEVDTDVIWNAIHNDIPVLRDFLVQQLSSSPPDGAR